MIQINEIISKTKTKLLEDLPEFLSLEGKEQYFIGKKIEKYASNTLEKLGGNFQTSSEFAKFIDILYGCQQLDDFGESWAPTEEKVEGWILFLKKFKQ